jgi:hypothetical protein
LFLFINAVLVQSYFNKIKTLVDLSEPDDLGITDQPSTVYIPLCLPSYPAKQLDFKGNIYTHTSAAQIFIFMPSKILIYIQNIVYHYDACLHLKNNFINIYYVQNPNFMNQFSLQTK